MSEAQRPNGSGTPSADSLKGVDGLQRVVNATRYTLHGLREAYSHEAAFRQELLAFLLLTPVAIWLPVPAVERLVLVLFMVVVLVVELLNTAIESIVDRVSMDLHPLAGRAKDLGSAAVGISILMSMLAWAVIAGPVLIRLL